MQSVQEFEREVRYKCPVCEGEGLVEVHEGFLPWNEDCGNCEGTGYCNWIRNIIPLDYYGEEGWK